MTRNHDEDELNLLSLWPRLYNARKTTNTTTSSGSSLWWLRRLTQREGVEVHIMKKKHRREGKGAYLVAPLFLTLIKVIIDEALPTCAFQAPPFLSPHSSQALETQSSKS